MDFSVYVSLHILGTQVIEQKNMWMNTEGTDYKIYIIEVFYKGQYLLILCLKKKNSFEIYFN